MILKEFLTSGLWKMSDVFALPLVSMVWKASINVLLGVALDAGDILSGDIFILPFPFRSASKFLGNQLLKPFPFLFFSRLSSSWGTSGTGSTATSSATASSPFPGLD